MKRTTSILTCLIVAGLAWAQSPEIIQNTRSKLQTVQKNATAASNQAVGGKVPSKPAAGVPNTAVKAGTSPAKAGSAAQAPAKPAPVQKAAPVPTKSSVAIAVKPAVQAHATAGKTSALPAKAGSVAQAQAKPAPVQKAAPVPAKSSVAIAVKPAVQAHATAGKTGASPAKAGSVAPAKPGAVQAKSAAVVAVKPAASAKSAKAAVEPKKAAPTPKSSPPAAASSSESSTASAGEGAKNDDKDGPEQKWSMSGKRDPFVSPVVNHTGGSGCSTGKKCLEIGSINLRGIVRSEAGFIAVVTNSLNKAYFLRENDPVFDGYVVKITGDSVTFKEMLQDRLGKTLTREVVKKITAPAV